MARCAGYVRDHADIGGLFAGSFTIESKRGEAVRFEIDCRLIYDQDAVYKTIIRYASVSIYDEDGREVPTDFCYAEFEKYLKE